MKRKLTPQEKKELSYARDGRNAVAESRRQGRKGIARRKATANRALRRAEAQAMLGPDADGFAARTGRRSWRKIPDIPLAEYVDARLDCREASGMNDAARASDLLQRGRTRARKRPLSFKGSLQPKWRGEPPAGVPQRTQHVG